MNAGCYGRRDLALRRARRGPDARRGVRACGCPSAYATGYRSVRRADGSRARRHLHRGVVRVSAAATRGRARERIAELLRRRIATQPLHLPNAGSVFRNPAGDHAARLIESCGLKGYAIGGARVSEKHANFIVNPEGRARAADIEAIIAHVRDVVRAQTGVDLEPEVQSSVSAHERAGPSQARVAPSRSDERAAPRVHTNERVRQGGGADGRAVGGARDLVPVRQRRAGGARREGRGRARVRPEGAAALRPAARGLRRARSSRCTAGSARTAPCRARWRRWASRTRAAA